MMNVKICDLYPYEPSGVRAKVDRQKKNVNSGTAKPIMILSVDGDYLVIDGTNRVLAARELGLSEIIAKEASIQEQEMRPYKDALDQAKKEKQCGFDNVPIDNSITCRSKRY